MWSQIRGYPLQAFIVCHVAYLFSQSDLALFSYALPSIRSTYEISLEAMGWVIAISYSFGALVQIYIGTLTDYFGRKRLLMIITVLSSLFIAAHSVVPDNSAYLIIGGKYFFWGVILITILRGLAIASGGALYPTTGAIVTEEAPARYRGLFAGLLQTGYPLGWFLAAIFAAPLLENYGWRVLFVTGLISIPYVWIIKKFLRETKRFSSQNKNIKNFNLTVTGSLLGKIALLFHPSMRSRTLTLFFAQFMFVIAYGGSAVFFPTYFFESRGLQLADSAILVGVGNGIAVFGYILAAYVGEFVLTRRTTVIIWTVLGALSFLYLVWFTSEYIETLIAFSVMSMFFYGTAAVKFAYIAETFPTAIRATGLSVCSSLAVNLGIAFGPLLISYSVSIWGWDMAFSTVVAIPLFMAGVLYFRLEPLPSGLELEEIEKVLKSQSDY